MVGSVAAPWRLATEDEGNLDAFDPDLDEDGEFDEDDEDDDEEDEDDDDLIDLDDEFDADDEEKPHPGRFDE